VKTKTTLVWTKSRVELYAVSSVDLRLEFVVFPHNSELDDSLRDRDHLQGSSVFRLLFEEGGVFEGGGEFCVGRVSARSLQVATTAKSFRNTFNSEEERLRNKLGSSDFDIPISILLKDPKIPRAPYVAGHS
jgi:hypothetical protein